MPNVPNNQLIVDNIAAGIDRNNGTNGKGGTVTPGNLIVVNAAGSVTNIDNIPIEEFKDSPTIERAEQCTCVHKLRLSYSEALNRLAVYGRGTLVSDSSGNFYRILSTTIQYQGGGFALLTITSESISFDVPPDKVSIKPVRLGLDIMKHPRYFYALMPTNQIPNFVGINDTPDQIIAKQAIIRAIQAYRENPLIPTLQNINNMTGKLHDQIIANFSSGLFTITKTNPNFNGRWPQTESPAIGTLFAGGLPYPPLAINATQPNPATYFVAITTSAVDPNNKIALAKAAAMEIIGKLWRMEDTPIVNGIELKWTEYYFRPAPLNLGGYIEDPAQATPALPDYFYSTAYPPDASQTIYDLLTKFNPQCFSQNGKFGGPTAISWLRDADDYDYDRTWFGVVRTWLGAPLGSWDADLYNQKDRPSTPSGDSGYRNLLMS